MSEPAHRTGIIELDLSCGSQLLLNVEAGPLGGGRYFLSSGRTATTKLETAAHGILVLMDALFSCLGASLDALVLDQDLADLISDHPNRALLFQESSGVHCRRAKFYRHANGWHRLRPTREGARIQTNGVTHPRRPPRPKGEVYRRHIFELGLDLSFRVADPERDLALFHGWMNQKRVARFWELDQPPEVLAEYLHRQCQDPHQYPLIGCFNEEAFGYFEVYWTPEDRLGPYYHAHPYDRGMHVLVGNRRFLGQRFTYAWLSGLTHYLLIDDPRTRRVMGEPRIDNLAMLRYQSRLPCWKQLKVFDFPHKRAALMACSAERFFEGMVLP